MKLWSRGKSSSNESSPSESSSYVTKSWKLNKSSSYGKILIILNCQGFVMAKCLEFLLPQYHYTAMMPKELVKLAKNNPESLSKLEQNFDLYIISDRVIRILQEYNINIPKEKIIEIPRFEFGAYHPDLAFLSSNNPRIVINKCHSSLIYKAHQARLSQSDTLKLFCDKVYNELGYYGEWEHEKQAVLQAYNKAGIDLSGYIEKWSRSQAFMLRSNHPSVECLFDICRILITSKIPLPSGVKIASYKGYCPIDDDFKSVVIYPVYEEIAEYYGVSGSYCFQIKNSPQTLTLEEFIAYSFSLYDGFKDNAADIITESESRLAPNIDEYLTQHFDYEPIRKIA